MTYKERVIEEKSELDSKLVKLLAFIGSPSDITATWQGLGRDEQQRLEIQARLMAAYSNVLGDRIANFKGD